MLTTVKELRTKDLEDIIRDQNTQKQDTHTPEPPHLLNGIYKFRYFMEAEYNPPTFSYMIV